MNNEMKFERTACSFPTVRWRNWAWWASPCLHGWDRDHILLMPQEMTALQLLHALEAYLGPP